MTELKPCPCCGNEAHLNKIDDGGWVRCGDTTACGLETPWFDDILEALKAWNNRISWQVGTKVVCKLPGEVLTIGQISIKPHEGKLIVCTTEGPFIVSKDGSFKKIGSPPEEE